MSIYADSVINVDAGISDNTYLSGYTGIVNTWKIGNKTFKACNPYSITPCEVFNPTYPEEGYISIDNRGNISYGNFNTSNASYVITVITNNNISSTIEIHVNESDVNPIGPPPETNDYIPPYVDIDVNKEDQNQGTAILTENNIYLLNSWNIFTGQGIIYPIDLPPSRFDFTYPQTGYIIVDKRGNISYGDFSLQNEYTIQTNLSNNRTAKFIIRITNSKDPGPPPTPPETIQYVPNFVQINSGESGSKELLNNTHKLEYFRVNGTIILDEFRENSGYIKVDNLGTISYGNFTKYGSYTINVKLTGYLDEIPFFLTILQSLEYIPSTYNYSIGGEKSSISLTPLDPNRQIDSYSVSYGGNIVNMKPNVKFNDNGGYINVDNTGTITFESFKLPQIYSISVNIGKIQVPFTLNVINNPINQIKYDPNNVYLETDASSVAPLLNLYYKENVNYVNYYTVSSLSLKETKFELNKVNVIGAGTISVNSIGTITYGKFTNKDIGTVFHVSVNVTQGNLTKDIPFTITIIEKSEGDGGEDKNKFDWNKKYGPLALWVWILIIIVILIVVILIIVWIVKMNKKGNNVVENKE